MRELDELLLRYLNTWYPHVDDDEKAAFQSLLALPDTALIGYLLHKDSYAPEFHHVIQHILNGAGP